MHSILQFPNHFPPDNLIWSSKPKQPDEVNIHTVYLKILKIREKWLTRSHPIWNQGSCLQIVSFCYSLLLYTVLKYTGLGTWLGSVQTCDLASLLSWPPAAWSCLIQSLLSSLSAWSEIQTSPWYSIPLHIREGVSLYWLAALKHQWPSSQSSLAPIKCTSADSIGGGSKGSKMHLGWKVTLQTIAANTTSLSIGIWKPKNHYWLGKSQQHTFKDLKVC